MTSRWDRAWRTLLMIPFGALWAPIVGVLMMNCFALSVGKLPGLSDPWGLLLLSAWFGSPFGAIVAPVAWYALMDRVSFFRALNVTTAAAIAGGLIVAHLLRNTDLHEASGLAMIPGAVVGALAGAVLLRRRSRAPMAAGPEV